MAPNAWLYQKDLTTIRVVQRELDAGAEVVILGPDGQNQQAFTTVDAASQFREALIARILAIGYAQAWESPEH
ncbi:MAG TPA: hypothetical protein VIX63_17085 [Vicinamibacterales bacterium]